MVSTVKVFTVIIALPVKLPATQEDAVKVDNVYVVVLAGLTATIKGLVDPEKDVPSDKVPLQGPLPVTAMLTLAEPPTQIGVDPLITPVGCGFTVKFNVAVESHPPALVVVNVFIPPVV